MATLYVENVPEELYEALRGQARRHRRSIAAEVVSLLEANVPTHQGVGVPAQVSALGRAAPFQEATHRRAVSSHGRNAAGGPLPVNTVVTDASVAAKWFLPPASEPLKDEALDLLHDYFEGRSQFAVPDLFWAECVNIFWEAVRQGWWNRPTEEEAILNLKGRRLPTTPSAELLEDAFNIASTFETTVYDAL